MSIIVVFRSRLRPEHAEEYADVAREIAALALEQPGIVAFKTFAASDDERVTIAEFADEAAVIAWRENARHKEAQTAGRERFYTECRVQVCNVLRNYGTTKL